MTHESLLFIETSIARITAGVAPATALFTAAYIYAQMAAALVQTFNQPVSIGSEWEALASRNGPIPSLPREWPFP